MAEYPYDADIDVARLRVDVSNPRLPDGDYTQRDALLRLAALQGPRLVGLAQHISKNGLNPAQRFIVVPDGREFTVLDGNRRLAAIRALDTPAIFTNLSATLLRRLKLLAADGTVPKQVGCVVFADREQADPWVELTHLNQAGGVSTARWSSQQKARHEERKGKKPLALQVLDFVRTGGHLSEATTKLIDDGTFPMSMITRMLETRDAKPVLGIETTDGQVATRYPREQVLRGLAKFIDDIGTGRRDTRSLNTTKQRLAYLSEFKPSELPDPTTKGPDAVPLEEAPLAATVRKATRRVRSRPSTAGRAYLIPPDYELRIPRDRINSIFHELRSKVRVDDAPNAAGALLRMFLEMSLDEYITKNRLTPKRDQLAEKYAAVQEHLEKSQTMDPKALRNIGLALFDTQRRVTTLHAIVHDRTFTIGGRELKEYWGRLERLFEALWP